MEENTTEKRSVGRPALQDEEKSHIHVRCRTARKAAYVRQANAENMTLVAWIFKHLDKVAKYEE